MTTIAFKASPESFSIASDSACVRGSIQAGTMIKVIASPNHNVAGACGSAIFCQSFLTWVYNGCEGEPPQATETENNMDLGFFAYDWNGKTMLRVFEPGGWLDLEADLYALGSGRDVALGALYAGVFPEDAVRSAITFDVYSGGEVITCTSKRGPLPKALPKPLPTDTVQRHRAYR